ncbi:hypothetical protein AKJ50_00020 [candidate division MSBL1 archaeon SCGC-AAA382A13]|uniref:Dihydrolipoyl dehydrogenase n=1 Tax=candidate division MSBL1 archaeon SCGC-AAA382A13 TaxID=1698279 RepID=A0A133VH02_9EURY|nr:hypothetical protein AKJ50_00020 [candidate division MSBL1 archaeon SCGC-AAA382A13]
MEKYDVIVVGSGSGMNIASRAVRDGRKVAVIDKDPPGGTCLNRGCIPSKVMIYPADIISEVKNFSKLGINFSDLEVDFQKIMERTRKSFLPDRERIKKNLKQESNLTFYNDKGRFVSDYTMKVSGEEIKADKIFLFSGSRPLIPPIEGINDIDYLTNRNIFDLSEKPESLIIIGGGYVATEFAHFFSAIGTEVTILEQMDRLLVQQDPEISKLLEEKLSSRMAVKTNHKVEKVGKSGEKKFVIAKNTETEEEMEITGESILLATGRRSNADLLEVDNTGVKTNEDGWIISNEFLETTKKNIWVGGDATGKYMFKHVANYEAAVAWHNAFSDHKMKIDYHAIPSAVFTHPQIASVGLNIEEAKKEHDAVLVGKSEYKDTAYGYAMGVEDGFCKIIINPDNGEILGAHIIGPFAPLLIQEVINLMYTEERSVNPLYDALHIHPALSEVVSWSLDNLKEV